jgi:hypothetical protein
MYPLMWRKGNLGQRRVKVKSNRFVGVKNGAYFLFPVTTGGQYRAAFSQISHGNDQPVRERERKNAV